MYQNYRSNRSAFERTLYDSSVLRCSTSLERALYLCDIEFLKAGSISANLDAGQSDVGSFANTRTFDQFQLLEKQHPTQNA
jgi:hypothetical protein